MGSPAKYRGFRTDRVPLSRGSSSSGRRGDKLTADGHGIVDKLLVAVTNQRYALGGGPWYSAEGVSALLPQRRGRRKEGELGNKIADRPHHCRPADVMATANVGYLNLPKDTRQRWSSQSTLTVF